MSLRPLPLLLLCALAAAGAPARGAEPEVRAFWADGFNEAFKTPEQVDLLLKRLRLANCNAVFAQMRKRGDAYYDSRYEPWASDNPQHFDALAYLIQAAHEGSPRIQVHAWINTFAVGNWPANPFHIGEMHPEWRSISDQGAEHDGEATKTDPGHPDAADWTFRVYLDVARRYDVDGIHFDFVRYGGREWGYNPVSVARYNARYGLSGQPRPGDARWVQWRRDQVTGFVRKVYAMAAAVKPSVTVSAATITWGEGPDNEAEWAGKTAAMTRVFQDWRGWMREGIVDLNCLMSYYREARHATWYRKWLAWAKNNQYDRYAALASGIWLNPIEDSLAQIAAVRAPTRGGRRARGAMLYSYAGTNAGADGRTVQYNEELYAALSKPSAHAARPPFAEPAPFPTLPWKARPTRGHVKGFVLDGESLQPADGARVTLAGGGARRAVTADGTGFYAFIDVRPGAYTVRVEPRGYVARTGSVQVSAGRVATANLFVGGSRVSSPADVGDAHALRQGAPVRLRSATVVGGTDTFPGRVVVYGALGTPLLVRLGRAPILPLVPGDVVAINGAVTTVDGERAIEASAVRLVDMRREAEVVRPLTATDIDRAGAGGALARAVGEVVEVRHDRLVLQTAAGPVEVMMADRKDPGVEAPVVPLLVPPRGAWLEVTGICTVTRGAGGTRLVRLRPRTSADVREAPTPLALRLRRAAVWVLPALFGCSRGLAETRDAANGQGRAG